MDFRVKKVTDWKKENLHAQLNPLLTSALKKKKKWPFIPNLYLWKDTILRHETN